MKNIFRSGIMRMMLTVLLVMGGAQVTLADDGSFSAANDSTGMANDSTGMANDSTYVDNNNGDWDDGQRSLEQPSKFERKGERYVVEISNASQLAWFARKYRIENNDEEKKLLAKAKLIITRDINLEGHYWRGIGKNTYAFEGEIQGNGHTISNMTTRNGYVVYSGLIDKITGDCKIDGLKFRNYRDVFYGNATAHGVIAGGVTKGRNIELTNITLDDCKIMAHDQSGILIGLVQEADELTINNIRITSPQLDVNLDGGLLIGHSKNVKKLEVSNVAIRGIGGFNYTVKPTNNASSCFIGRLEQCNYFSISDVTIEDCFIQCFHPASIYCGMLVGLIEGSSGIIKNVTVSNCKLHGANNYVGGLVGVHFNSQNKQITMDNCRVVGTRIDEGGGHECNYWGGLIGEAQGRWIISNCFAEVNFGSNIYDGWGGLIGKTYGGHTFVEIRNCFSHMSDSFFKWSGDSRSGGLVGYIDNNSSVHIFSSGVLSGDYENKNSRSLLVGAIINNADLECKNCFVDSKFKGCSQDDLMKKAFGKSVRDAGAKFTYSGQIHPLLINTNEEKSEVSYSAAKMNELGACLGVQGHGPGSDDRRQYLPLSDPMNGKVVRYKGADNVESVESKHLLKSYGLYSDGTGKYAMMAVGDTAMVEMKPLDNKWYIENKDDLATYNARENSYRFRTVVKNQTNETERTLDIRTTNIPKVTITGHYDPVRQRTTLSWIPTYTSQDNHDELKKDFTWALFRGTTQLTDNLYLDSCRYIDVTPDIRADQDKTLNNYSVALVSKSMSLTAKDDHASNSHANCQIYASDEIKLGIKGVHNKDGVELSTEIPNSKRFDNCKVYLYRWDVATGLTIMGNIYAKQGDITPEKLEKAFADSIRARKNVKRVEIGKFLFNAALKDSHVTFKYQDNITDFSTNYFYVFCCEDFQDSYYKQFGAFFSEQYMYIPSQQVQITDLVCSKGESDTKVTVTWKSKLSENNTSVRYRVLRKLYSGDDSNLTLSNDTVGWDVRHEETNSNLVNTYTDETPPGYIYRYRINAYIVLNNVYDYDFIAASATDIGYTSGRGTILGKITYSSGNSRVKGVDVALTADKESLKDVAVKQKVRQFWGSNDYLPLASGLTGDFWNGDWTVQFILRPTGNGRLVSLPGTMAVIYENGNLLMADKSIKINAQGHNYIIIRHSSTDKSYQLGYVKRPDGTEDYTHYIEVKESDMKNWMMNKDEKTVTNVLAFGCISNSAAAEIKGHHSFEGLLDEVRVWNRQLSEEEVRITFDRYITGYETGLQAYYTFDDGVRDRVYDISHTANGEQNGHHAQVVNKDATSKRFYPDVMSLDDMNSVLCYRGTTDENGQYQIAGIPYCGEGTNFMVQPLLGTHEFYPAQVRRFVSKSSLVHQDVDFADQSSFRIPVQAVYSGTTIPASGLTVTVDGLPAKSTGGSVVTDAEGLATVSVPIGKHQLRLYAKGHEMANDGYPCNITVDANGNVIVQEKDKLQDKDGYIDFQKDLTAPLTFYDNTRVTLCGHAVGGSVENSKLMGDKSKYNNIGPVTITLKAENLVGGHFTTDGKDHSYSALGVNCTVIYKKESIEITTNDDNGEYFVLLPPVDYKVEHVKSAACKSELTPLGDSDFELDKILTSLYFDVSRQYADLVTTNAVGSVIDARTYVIVDSMVVDSVVSVVETAKVSESISSSDSVNGSNATTATLYHLKKNFACYVEPTFEVYNAMVGENDRLMMGEEKVTVGSDETLTIWNATTRDGSSNAYNLKMTYQKDGNPVTTGFPVFKMGAIYKLKVKLYDNYVNRKTGKSTHYDLSGVPIHFVNGLASKGFTTIVTNDIKALPDTFSYTTIGDSVTANAASNGVLEYAFTGGFPNAVYPYTQKLEISYEANNRIYTMEKPIEGIVIGTVPIPGKDFVTKGPNIVDLVLRDPPGSGSYSWIDAGSTVGNTYTHTHSGGADYGRTWCIGELKTDDDVILEWQTVVPGVAEKGLTRKMMHSSKSFADNRDHGYTVSVTGSGSTTKTVSYTFNDKLQTSSSSGYVGEDGDIYIGRGTNTIITKSRDIIFHKTTLVGGNGVLKSDKGNHYQLNDSIGLSDGLKDIETTFAYTQKHIVNTLIPELRKQRRNLCTVVDDFNNLPASVDSTSYFVLRNVSDDIDEWVSDTDYVCVYSSEAFQTNMVSVTNSWIKGWENAIAANEETKYKTNDKYGSSKKTEKYEDDKASSRFTPEVEFGYLGNISLDGGASKTTTLSRSYTDNQTNSVAWTVKETNALHDSYDTEYFCDGKKVHRTINFNFNVTGNYSWTKNQTYTQNLGYTISDPVGGDYLSVNTYLPSIEIKEDGNNFVTDRPSFKEFFVFRLIGGQTRCPYEGPKESLYYKGKDNKPVTISDGSIPVEVPQIRLGQHIISNVPNGRNVTVPVTLSNTSTATITLYPWYPTFNFQMKPGSNPNGLQLIVDGATIGSSALPLTLGPGQSITKTLEFKQTRLDILDYKDIVFCFYSDCQSTNGVYDTLTIQFKPASSPVTLKIDAQYVNKENFKSPVNIIIQDYEPTFEKFVGIRLQRKRKDLNEAFRTVANIINKKRAEQFGVAVPDGAIFIDSTDTKKIQTLPVWMDSVPDGTYIYRAVSYSKYGDKEEVQTISDTITVIKDTSSPVLLGKPVPADGYYSGDTEMALQFNEVINTSKLTGNSIVCKGALNDAILTHNCGLHFDGNAPAKTSARVNIFGKSTTVGLWYKPQVGKRSCLFSQQIVDSKNKSIPVALYYNEDGTMTVYCGGDSVRSQKKAMQGTQLISDWMYAILTVNRSAQGGKGTITLYNLFGTSSEDQSKFISLQDADNVTAYDCNVPLYVGGSAAGDPCYADIEGFVVYDDYVQFEAAAADKSNKHISNVRGLRAYWPMDEGHGDIARDKVFSRNLTLQTADGWYTPVSNYALNLNGKDQYLSLKTDLIGITQLEDYTLEMWFRTESSSTSGEMALFSCGYGGNVKTKTEVDARKHVSLLLGTNGQIIFNATGKTYEFGKGYNDQKWHHLALNVPRDGYVSLLVDTMDITANVSILGDSLGTLERANMQLGALVYKDAAGDKTCDYFNGRIDEVRIWNAMKTVRNIKANVYTRLGGDEAGLVAYYPFEYDTLVANQQVTYTTLQDRAKADNIPGFKPAGTPGCFGFKADNAPLYMNGAMLRSADFETPVTVDFTTNGKDRIVINFPATLAKYRIEGCTLNFQLKDVQDMAGNDIVQPVNWSVYVRQNTLRWMAEDNSLLSYAGSTDNTTVYIYNDSKTAQEWGIVNVPSWLNVSQKTGITEPYGYSTVSVSSVEGTAIGNYSSTMYLIGTNDSIFEPLEMNLSVTAEEPDWNVCTTDGAIWMSILGRLRIGDAWCTDENTIVGVFDEQNRCLAITSPEYNEKMCTYFVSLNVKGNADMKGAKLFFRIWDASTGIIYEKANISYGNKYSENYHIFNDKAVLGTFNKPCIISAGDNISQTLAFHEGWNWISLWVTPDAGSEADKVFAPIKDYITEIKTPTGGKKPEQFNKLTLKPADSYRIHLTEGATLAIEGKKVDPAGIQMTFKRPRKEENFSWCWIGYPLWRMTTLSEAFADFTPVPDDIVKGEDAYAMFNGSTWIGELKYLTPGAGYVYGNHWANGQDTAWHYPSITRSSSPLQSNGFSLSCEPSEYEDYTFVDVSVVDGNGDLITGFDYLLGAFIEVGGSTECRGVAEGVSGKTCPISIFGEYGDTYTFRLYNKSDGQVYNLVGTKDYDNVTSPQTLRLTLSTTGIESVDADSDDEGDYYNVGGIKVNDNTRQHGVYVTKGKKVLRTPDK